ncbi:MAG TPA: hypothetical protein DEB46_04850 [Myxococcales bacterium]|nr:hypothetical protein [Myxococcales bacterium]
MTRLGSDIPSSPPSSGFRVAPFLLAALCCALIAWTASLAAEGDLFRIQKLDIRGLSPAEVEVAKVYAAVPVGTLLYQVDVDALRRRLQYLPGITQIEIKRELPNRLIIELLPDQARAAALVQGRRVLLNRQGVAFSMDEKTQDLPLIVGAESGADLRLAVHAVSAFAAVREPDELAMVQVGPLGVSVWDRAGVEHRLGKRRLRERLDRGRRVLKEASRRGVQIDRLLLDDEGHPNRVVARFGRPG